MTLQSPPPPPPPGSPYGAASPSAVLPPAAPPPPDDRRPRTRPRLAAFDRLKILLLIAVLLGFLVAKQHADVPIMSWNDAIRDQLRAKQWLLWLAGVEAIRQVHYAISERVEGYHRFWTHRVWGRWDAFVARRNPWLRYRVARAGKVVFWLAVAAFFFAGRWHLSPVQALVESPSRIWNILFGPISGLPLLPYFALITGMAVMQFVAIFWFMSKGGVETYMPTEITTRFADVWGQDHVVERVKENMIFLERPDELEAKGGHVPGGILLWGPPGTGKTLMAEAVAGETGRPYVFVEPGAFQNMFFGVGILKVKSLYRRLRKLALRYGGVIVFFDEADVLGNRGGAVSGLSPRDSFADDPVFGASACGGFRYLSTNSQRIVVDAAMAGRRHGAEGPAVGRLRKVIAPGMRGGGSMGELQALLAEMSGLKKPRGFFGRRVRQFLCMPPKQPPKYRILTMMATNMPTSLDPALLRPGRLDRVYKVGYPSKDGRMRTYEGYFSKIKHSLSAAQVEKLATMTPYATGATIKDLVNESLIVAMRKGRDFVTWPDVIEARKLKMVGPGENVDYIDRERHSVAIHEACHAIMTYRVQKGHDIDIATIEKGADFLGFVAPIPMEERFTEWRSTYESDLLVSLASLAGERIFFDGDNTSGVTGDLRSATSIAIAMEAYWGMGATVASHLADSRPDGELQLANGMLRGDLGRRVEERLQALLERATDLIRDNRFEVLAIAHALETHKTITGDDIAAIVHGYPGPLVDGRPYHLPEFVEVAERYHAKVLEAHREQRRVDAVIPTFAPSTAGAFAAAATPAPGVVGATPPPSDPATPGA